MAMRGIRLRAAAAAAGIAAGLFGAVSVVPAATASAAARDGSCDPGEFCYYWGSNFYGAVSDFTASVGDYGTTQPSCYDFKGTAAGHGQCIKNNAESVWNRSGVTVTVFYNSWFGGVAQPIPPYSAVNLNGDLSDNNASHRFG